MDRPPRRPRHLVSGICLAVVMTVWIASGWWYVEYRPGGVIAGARCGILIVTRRDGIPQAGLEIGRNEWAFAWWRYSLDVFQGGWSLRVPLWLLGFVPVSFGLTRELFWHRCRRLLFIHCPCGYSRVGLPPDASCPECGKKS